jgi:hypothetical protein
MLYPDIQKLTKDERNRKTAALGAEAVSAIIQRRSGVPEQFDSLQAIDSAGLAELIASI